MDASRFGLQNFWPPKCRSRKILATQCPSVPVYTLVATNHGHGVASALNTPRAADVPVSPMRALTESVFCSGRRPDRRPNIPISPSSRLTSPGAVKSETEPIQIIVEFLQVPGLCQLNDLSTALCNCKAITNAGQRRGHRSTALCLHEDRFYTWLRPLRCTGQMHGKRRRIEFYVAHPRRLPKRSKIQGFQSQKDIFSRSPKVWKCHWSFN